MVSRGIRDSSFSGLGRLVRRGNRVLRARSGGRCQEHGVFVDGSPHGVRRHRLRSRSMDACCLLCQRPLATLASGFSRRFRAGAHCRWLSGALSGVLAKRCCFRAAIRRAASFGLCSGRPIVGTPDVQVPSPVAAPVARAPAQHAHAGVAVVLCPPVRLMASGLICGSGTLASRPHAAGCRCCGRTSRIRCAIRRLCLRAHPGYRD